MVKLCALVITLLVNNEILHHVHLFVQYSLWQCVALLSIMLSQCVSRYKRCVGRKDTPFVSGSKWVVCVTILSVHHMATGQIAIKHNSLWDKHTNKRKGGSVDQYVVYICFISYWNWSIKDNTVQWKPSNIDVNWRKLFFKKSGRKEKQGQCVFRIWCILCPNYSFPVPCCGVCVWKKSMVMYDLSLIFVKITEEVIVVYIDCDSDFKWTLSNPFDWFKCLM